MLRRMIVPALFGIIGCAILVSLGVWQLNRADEKAELIAAMEARLFDAPVPLPDLPDPTTDRYRPVTVSGHFMPERSFVMAAQRAAGPGFHLISAFETADDRRILIERGFLREDTRPGLPDDPDAPARVTGNLPWPQDADRFTPAPDAERNLHFARDVDLLADQLGTEPVLLVLRESTQPLPGVSPVPVDAVAIPDNHFGYAVQWFLMAVAWAGVTVFYLWRIRTQSD